MTSPFRCQDRLVLAVALGVGFGSSVASCVLMSGRDAPAGWAPGAWDGLRPCSLMVDQLKVGVKLRWLSLWLSGGEGAKELWLYHVVSFCTCCIHIPSKNAGQGATMSFPTTIDLFGWWAKKKSTFIICHFRMICVGMCCSIQDFPWIDWRWESRQSYVFVQMVRKHPVFWVFFILDLDCLKLFSLQMVFWFFV